jgi:hypothetical protein
MHTFSKLVPSVTPEQTSSVTVYTRTLIRKQQHANLTLCRKIVVAIYEGIWKSGSVVPLIHKLGTKCEKMGNLKFRTSNARQKEPRLITEQEGPHGLSGSF